jgi:hypothetical protein
MHVLLDSTSILKSSNVIHEEKGVNVIIIQKQKKNLQNLKKMLKKEEKLDGNIVNAITKF